MRIVFDLYDTGLGNNGGSRTLLLCAEAMVSLGHEVMVYSNVGSRYTWHKPKGVKIITGNHMPPSDLAISSTPKTVDHTVMCAAKKKVYYIRGYEVFWCSKKLVHDGYKKLKCIVNSEWLQRKLRSLGVNSDVVYPGLDYDIFYNNRDERENIRRKDTSD